MKTNYKFIVALFATLIGVVWFCSNASAQVSPATPAATLSTAAIVITLLSLSIGVLNQFVQTGKIANTWALPATLLPYLVTIGSFLGGVYSYFQTQSPLTLNASTLFYGLTSGLTMLLVGSSPGLVTHLFGGQVSKLRPAPTDKK